MKEFEYFGIFFSKKEKRKLIHFLMGEKELWDMVKHSKKKYMDHCTLLHRNQLKGKETLARKLFVSLYTQYFTKPIITVTHVGYNEKAMAFKVNLSNKSCANETPHITICTFKDGVPVDSNSIINWKEIPPITLEGDIRLIKRK